MQTTTINDLEKMDPRSRASLINALSGYKSPMLLGSGTKTSQNLALFSNIFHIGSHPATIGVFFRPHSEKHSLNNILKHKEFSLNFINEKQIKQAHQTSAKYRTNEFNEVELEAIFHKNFAAPFVKNAPLSLGLSLVEHIPVKTNDTSIVIAQISFIESQSNLTRNDYFKLNDHSDVVVSGLDSYHSASHLYRLSYAKPNKTAEEI